MPLDNETQEDNSSEETQNNENTETNEEETSSDEQSETNDTVDDSSEDEGEKFVSIDSLPPELKPMGKKMFSNYQKALAKGKEELKQEEERLGIKYADAIVRSNSLLELAKHPSFQLFLADLERGRPYGYSSQLRNDNGNNNSNEDGEEDNEQTLTASSVQKMIDSAVKQALKPYQDREIKNNFDRIKEKPYFNKQRARITELVNKGIPLDEAYDIATETDREIEKLRKKQTEEDVEKLKKKPRSEKSSSSNSPTITKKTVANLREALAIAAAQHGE